VLKGSGAFWLAIGDEYAAELKVASQKLGFHCRSWVVWYYTFGVNCRHKFTRSHAHLFYFVKDPQAFTFRYDDPENRVPSARQLVYADKRAHSKGRLPDDTWMLPPEDLSGLLNDREQSGEEHLAPPSEESPSWTLRPQDLTGGFSAAEDTWYFPRVAGTFKERAGFHGCQMPEQLLGRIIRCCSNLNDLVVDPFTGSATTLAVAKKLGRRFLGFEISPQYVKQGLARLGAIRVGDPLDGSAAPLASAPKTGENKNSPQASARRPAAPASEAQQRERLERHRQLAAAIAGVREAFRRTYDGFSADRVVADPDRNQAFLEECRRMGIAGDDRTWNILLFRLRKAGKLIDLPAIRRTAIGWNDCDGYLFASEIALQWMLRESESLDEILCDPALAARFDEQARGLAPGASSLEYRWAALKLRKQAKVARTRAAVLAAPRRLPPTMPLEALKPLKTSGVPECAGAYVVCSADARKRQTLYVGETLNLRQQLSRQFGNSSAQFRWRTLGAECRFDELHIACFPAQIEQAGRLAWECRLASQFDAKLNFRELIEAT
jgi:site-specific DNA-methyltransferase (adenine-specific)